MAHQPRGAFNRLFQVEGDVLYAALENETGEAQLSSWNVRYLVGSGGNEREVPRVVWFGSDQPQ
jgi:hypothetical protein